MYFFVILCLGDIMASIKEYLKYYKDLSFDEVSFNDVDSMLFTQIIYADFNKIVPSSKSEFILFSDAVRLILKKRVDNKREPKFIREIYDLLKELLDAKRYANVRLYYYEKIVDHEKQFCAMTFRFDGKVYVAFEGTDTSVIGWKEDFLLTKTFPVPSQKYSIQYLNQSLMFFDKEVYVGGHSKGGTLAMTAAMLTNFSNRIKIKSVYNFDGPGFMNHEFSTSACVKMRKKLKMFVPEDSTVGMLMLHTHSYRVVRSSALGLWQHNPLTWECFGNIFISGNLSKRSLQLEKSNIEFIQSMNLEERGKLIEVFFSILERLGIHDTTQIKKLNLAQALQILKDFSNVDSKTRQKLVSFLKIILKGM